MNSLFVDLGGKKEFPKYQIHKEHKIVDSRQMPAHEKAVPSGARQKAQITKWSKTKARRLSKGNGAHHSFGADNRT